MFALDCKAMSTSLTVHLRLICQNPPPAQRDGRPVIFGLQDKDRVLQPGRHTGDGSLVFECDVNAIPGADGTANIRGKFAHGPAAGRFLYLGLRYADAKDDDWIRRLKIPLSGITWEQANSGKTLEAKVDGHRAGSVALIGGAWKTL